MRSGWVFVLAGCVLVATVAGGAPPKEFKAEVQATGAVFGLSAPVPGVVHALLVVTGPEGFRVEGGFLGHEAIAVDLSLAKDSRGRRLPLVDGDYKWELRLFTPAAFGRRDAAVEPEPDTREARGSADAEPDQWVTFGRFAVERGGIVPLEEPRRGETRPATSTTATGMEAPLPGTREGRPGGQLPLGSQTDTSTARPEGTSVRPLWTGTGPLYNSESICSGCVNLDPDLLSGELLLKYYNNPYLTIRDSGFHGAQVPNDQLWRWWTWNGPLVLSQARLNGSGGTLPMTVEKDTPSNTLYLDTAGLVGIGTTTPSTAFNIQGLDIVQPVYAGVRLTTTGSANHFDLWASGTHYGFFDETAGTNPVVIYQGAPSHSLIVSENGKVGLGTATPTYRLHLQVGTNAYDGLVATSSDGVGTGAGALFGAIANWGSLGFQVHGSGRTISRYGITLGGWAEINQASGGNGLILATRTATPLVFATNTTERMRILSNGNVGIGTAVPAGSLDVNGSIFQRGGVLFADHVFEPGYKLESIEEHERFAWAHKRLPAIAGRTVDAEGREVVELGASQRGIVEELEKAHIYIGQLNDQLKARDRQLGELRQRLDVLAQRDRQVTELSEEVRTLNEKLARLAERLEKQSN